MEQPLVSIALATYNGEKFLRKQIDSLLAQDYLNLEIVISDDCSNDGTWEILNFYAQRDKRIRLLPLESNQGYVKNFMRVFLACRGSLISPCDQDDIWYENKITRLVSEINDADLIYCNNELIGGEDQVLNFSQTKRPVERYFFGNDCRSLIFCNTISGHTMLFRNHLLAKIKNYESIVYIDWMIAFLAASNGGVIFLNEILLKWRQHKSSLTFALRVNSQETRDISLKHTNIMLQEFSKVLNDHQDFAIKALNAWNKWINSYFNLSLFFLVIRYRAVTHKCYLVKFPALKYLFGHKLKKFLRPKYY